MSRNQQLLRMRRRRSRRRAGNKAFTKRFLAFMRGARGPIGPIRRAYLKHIITADDLFPREAK